MTGRSQAYAKKSRVPLDSAQHGSFSHLRGDDSVDGIKNVSKITGGKRTPADDTDATLLQTFHMPQDRIMVAKAWSNRSERLTA